MIKSVVIFAFLLIVASLGSALYHLVKRGENEQSDTTAKALTWRIGLSVVLFMLIFLGYATGFIKPEGIGARIHHADLQEKSPSAR